MYNLIYENSTDTYKLRPRLIERILLKLFCETDMLKCNKLL